jgi:hypothetical protein
VEGKLIVLVGIVALLAIFGVVVWTAFGKSSPGQFCGGITGTSCPAGFTCKYDGNYPDASGVCVNALDPLMQKIYSIFPQIQPKKAYTCPVGEWVDCMPGPGPTKTECQKDYLDWAKSNCPNFRGAAL